MKMNIRSIHFRLIIWCSCLMVLASLLFGAYVYQGVHDRLYGEMEKTLTRRANQIAKNILPHAHGAEISDQINEVYSPEEGNRFIRISKNDHKIIYISGQPKDRQFNPDKIPLPIVKAKETRVENLAPDTDMLIVTIPAEVAGESFLIEMGILTDEMKTALHGLVVTLLIGLPVLVLFVSAGGYMLVRHSLKPVENIRATAEQITFGNLSNRLPVEHTGDALENLSLTLNQMLERLDDSYQQVSRFSADASHELRTPLTIMRAELESMIREEMSESLRARIGSVLEESERLSRVAENLFAISKMDAGEAKIAHVWFNLSELVKSTAEQMALLVTEKKINLNIKQTDFAPVLGDPARIKQVVVNLLDNAIKYTPEGGDISIKTFLAEKKAILEITDNGIGIPSDALPHVFKRFYRADEVRAPEISGGAGLGLSIVRSICQAHGGNVEIESIYGCGTTCRVELPLVNGNGKGRGHNVEA